MKLLYIGFITCVLQAFTEGNVRYVQIRNDSSPTIRVEPGNKLVFKCFVNCTKHNDEYSIRWYRNKAKKSVFLRLSNVSNDVTMAVVKNRQKRDDYFSQSRSPSFEELLKMQTELMQRLNPNWHVLDEFLSTPGSLDDNWVREEQETKYIDESIPAKKPVQRIVIIVIIILVFIGFLGIIFYCARLAVKKRLDATRGEQTDSRELRSLNVEPIVRRPIETHITPYPPASYIQPAPTSEPTPPPTYEEAVFNVPTAPSDRIVTPSAPRL